MEDYEKKLLDGWEEVYKKAQLTLWILLALKDSPKHMTEIKLYINKLTNGTIIADDQSMYRALRRFHNAELINFITKPSDSGPNRKVYSLSRTGSVVLNEFLARNIMGVFYQDSVKKLLSMK
jgi:PadR family transcriptional regulator PadR